MSDHDASPKEWTHAHSERHGPQRWISKQQRKQLLAQQAYIAAITGGRTNTSSSSAWKPVSVRASSRRRSSLEQQLDESTQVDPASGNPAEDSGSLSDAAASPVADPIEEGVEETSSEDDEQDVTYPPPSLAHAATMPMQRLVSAPLATAASFSDGEHKLAPFTMQTSEAAWCHCAACHTAQAHQRAAQHQYLLALRAAPRSARGATAYQLQHMSIDFSSVSLSPSHPFLSASSAGKQQRSRSAHHTPAATAHAHSFDEHASTNAWHEAAAHMQATAAESQHAAATASPTAQQSSPSATPSADTSFRARAPSRSVRALLAADPSKGSAAAVSAAVHSPAAPSVSSSSSAAASSSASDVPAPPPAAPSVPPPLSALLPRWFLIFLAMLKETDGRDKIAKCIQYGGRSLAILLQKLPALMWWTRYIWSRLQRGRAYDIARAAHVLRSTPTAPTAAVAAAVEKVVAPLTAAAHAHVSFSESLRAKYDSDTSIVRSVLQSNPVYSGALSRLSVLTAALSSGRRVIRVLKWTYTLPAWAKTFAAWKAQWRDNNDKAKQQQADAEEEEEQARAQAEEQKKAAADAAAAAAQRARSDSDASVHSSSDDSVAAVDEAPLPNFRFSHPHPPHLWRRLPWLSSVELLDLSLAVLTDVSDDLEWLSKYKFFPAKLGEKCGRVAMRCWFTTVLLDLALTVRIVRHYRWQGRQLQLQIEEAQLEFATVAHQITCAEEEHAQKVLRQQLRQNVQASPLFKRSDRQEAAEEEVSHTAAGAASVPSASAERASSAPPPCADESDPSSPLDLSVDLAALSHLSSLHASHLRLYRRLADLRTQASATRLSLFLQYLNLAKFTCDLGCATPMAWGVQKQHDTLVQSTGLVAGIIGVYKLAITIKPAA